MEQSSLSILVDETRVNNLLKQKSGVKAVVIEGCKLLFFIFFLLLYTGLSLSEPFSMMRTFEGYLRRRFDYNGAVTLESVNSVESFWRYTNLTLLPAIYGNDTEKYYFPGRAIDIFLPIDPDNRLLGAGARLRMIKILPNNDCEVEESFRAAFPTCYGPYTEASVDTMAFGPITETGTRLFQYNFARPDDLPYPGKVATYAPGGFMEPLTANYDRVIKRMRQLEQGDWLSGSVRAVFYDFTVYNFNLALYGVCSIAFEVSPSGRWVKTFRVEVIRQRFLNPLGSGTNEDFFMLALEVALVLCVFYFLFEECSELIGCERRGGPEGRRMPTIKCGYFLDTWNLLDWANLILIFIAFVARVITWTIASSREIFAGDPAEAGVATFTDYTAVADQVRLCRTLAAFNSVLIWFKAVKYITVIPWVSTFMVTVTVAQRNLGSFMVLFLTTMIGFVLAFCSAFGQQFETFRSPSQALYYLMRSFFGDAGMKFVYDTSPFVGTLLIMLFVVAFPFFLTNLFHAIMVGALSDAKDQIGTDAIKEWRRNVEKLEEFATAISQQLKLEHNFKKTLPGLYSRLRRRKTKRELKERLRDEEEHRKAYLSKSALAEAESGGFFGRRQKKLLASTAIKDDDSAEEDAMSEPDLGPELYDQSQLVTMGASTFGSVGASSPPGTKSGFRTTGFASLKNQTGTLGGTGMPELEPRAMKRVLKATEHVSNGVVQHATVAKDLLLNDMNDSREVLQGIGNVLEVLARRSNSLSAQQLDLLKNRFS